MNYDEGKFPEPSGKLPAVAPAELCRVFKAGALNKKRSDMRIRLIA